MKNAILSSPAFLFGILPAAFAQTVYPSVSAPFPGWVAAIAVIIVFAVVILVVAHVKK